MYYALIFCKSDYVYLPIYIKFYKIIVDAKKKHRKKNKWWFKILLYKISFTFACLFNIFVSTEKPFSSLD
ncbi:hypothetical protein PFAG_00981 [Plasmodium falciparum Santa Lucia]|uniref:Uncharacterized protein n=3 Tax=Plasmodium falciparum TaxID=5833 RepID=A0A024VSZ5_PLAFA|nr:hypothetical protein PFFVO_01026 [Plasmodium falciparum Vietnam Oak-Knoll (FVO)]ETW31859.1 hypothetical protein PFFCH_00643 [Plasmodium falciparum FCH/4]EUT90624.1 hypothetical protein PFAG_00981 [Plasmodium falciparum Santa Lucia]